jgi:hypothetical protein
MTTLDRQWRDALRYSIEDRASTSADDYGYAHEHDPSMILARRLLCATALAGVIMFALPMLIKARFPSTEVTTLDGERLKPSHEMSDFPEPQAPPLELLRGTLP